MAEMNQKDLKSRITSLAVLAGMGPQLEPTFVFLGNGSQSVILPLGDDAIPSCVAVALYNIAKSQGLNPSEYDIASNEEEVLTQAFGKLEADVKAALMQRPDLEGYCEEIRAHVKWMKDLAALFVAADMSSEVVEIVENAATQNQTMLDELTGKLESSKGDENGAPKLQD